MMPELLCRLYGTRQAPRSWQRETLTGTEAPGMAMGTLSRCSCKSPCGKFVGVVHGEDMLLG